MAKLITGIALVIFCGFCGYMLTKKYRVRKEFYKQYYAFNRSFLSEISFSRRPLESWLEKQPLSGAFETTVHGFLKGYFTAAEKTIAARTESAEKDCARYCDLYIKMGVLLGLTLLILLL